MAHRQPWVEPPRGGGIVAQAFRAEGECPECRAPVESDWHVCAECGAGLGAARPRLHAMSRESALPSVDIGDTAFVPLISGAKRPITITDSGARPSAGPHLSLESLVVHAREEAGPPPQPPTEDSRHRVTVVHPEASAPEIAPEDEALGVEPAFELATGPSPGAVVTAVEAPSTSTNLSPTVLVVAPERPAALRVSREDLREIQLMIDDAVKRALREYVAAQTQAASATVVAADSPRSMQLRGRLAGAGAGLLVGGSIANVIVFNWDKWIRGDSVSAVGWLQQMGLTGAAALAGAGAAAVAIARSFGRRRHRPRRAAGAGGTAWGTRASAHRAR